MKGFIKIFLGLSFLLLIMSGLIIYLKTRPTVILSPEEELNQVTIQEEKSLKPIFDLQNIQRIPLPTPTKPLLPPPTATTNILETSTNFEMGFSEIKEVIIIAKEFKYLPSEIKVPANTKVRLVFENQDKAPHDLKIENENFSIKTDLIAPGEKTILEFNAPPPGIYQISSTFHKNKRMKGVFIVE